MLRLIRQGIVYICMQRRKLLAGIGLIGATSTGAVAFTSASVSRDVEIAVEADDSAIVGLNPGTTNAAELVDGVLQIDTSNGDNDLNVDAVFTYGNENDPTGGFLFSVTNNDASERGFDFSYDSNEGSPSVAVFEVYDGDESSVGTFEDGTDVSLDLESGETAYVHMVVDTNGVAPTEDGLGGTLDIGVDSQ